MEQTKNLSRETAEATSEPGEKRVWRAPKLEIVPLMENTLFGPNFCGGDLLCQS